MKITTIALAAMMLPAAAMAQTTTPPATTPPAATNPPAAPAVATPTTTNPAAPVAGKNSFTQDQAKKRITDAGYTGVGALTLDDKGVWRGSASKDGKTVNVALDYQGNIVAQ